jgi:hypothetical protein
MLTVVSTGVGEALSAASRELVLAERVLRSRRLVRDRALRAFLDAGGSEREAARLAGVSPAYAHKIRRG